MLGSRFPGVCDCARRLRPCHVAADFTEDRGVLNRAINRAEINTGGGGIVQGPIPQRGAIGTNFMTRCILPRMTSWREKPAARLWLC